MTEDNRSPLYFFRGLKDALTEEDFAGEDDLVVFRFDFADDEQRALAQIERSVADNSQLLIVFADFGELWNEDHCVSTVRTITLKLFTLSPVIGGFRLILSFPGASIKLPSLFLNFARLMNRVPRVDSRKSPARDIVIDERKIPRKPPVPEHFSQDRAIANEMRTLETKATKAFGISLQVGEKFLQDLDAVGIDETFRWSKSGLIWTSSSDITFDSVLYRTSSMGITCITRRGTWRGVSVSIAHYSLLEFDQLQPWLKLIFALRHPFLFTPWALAKNEAAKAIYLVQPLPGGGPCALSLQNWLQTGDIMSYVAAVASCVSFALRHLHRDGILHRDLTIQNIYDFGGGLFKLAVTPRAKVLTEGSSIGIEGIPIRWLSPEALGTRTYREGDDIWALGVLLWELFTGGTVLPFSQCKSPEEVTACILDGAKLQKPPTCPQTFWDQIIAPCFASARYRPTSAQILEGVNEYVSVSLND
jgi:hypothetical protein